ncbi:hypothetical protein [Brevundimonas naejangsanensis]|uniref:hypothetical protein n=1 Tax=Brevundimonas naejangsanensis TaxID=588932 RepID=UPI0032083136
MPALDVQACEAELEDILTTVTSLTPAEVRAAIPKTRGKLYELYSVARLLSELTGRGLRARWSHPGPVKLKQGGGHADASKPHFILFNGNTLFGRLYTDVEVRTLGEWIGPVGDLSAFHEIDVVVLRDGHLLSPLHFDLLIGLECKAVADFEKNFVREALGRRRELSLLWDGVDPFGDPIQAWPGSIYRLVYIDPKGNNYRDSPAMFGVELLHWLPTP